MQTALPSVLPAEWNILCKQGVFWLCPSLELADIEVRESVIDEAMHGSVLAVCILVHKAWDEIGRDGNDKSLRDVKTTKKHHHQTTAAWVCVSGLINSGGNVHVQVNLEWWWRGSEQCSTQMKQHCSFRGIRVLCSCAGSYFITEIAQHLSTSFLFSSENHLPF